VEARGDVAVALGGGLRQLLGVDDEAPDVLAGVRQPMTTSASLARLASTWFCLARIASTRLVSRSAGTPRRSASLRFSELPATAAPSSATMSRSRSRYGLRMMFVTRSGGTVLVVRSTGMTSFSSSSLPDLPGWQST
jgi:hypothetical protein